MLLCTLQDTNVMVPWYSTRKIQDLMRKDHNQMFLCVPSEDLPMAKTSAQPMTGPSLHEAL
jgi:hypothetical protein